MEDLHEGTCGSCGEVGLLGESDRCATCARQALLAELQHSERAARAVRDAGAAPTRPRRNTGALPRTQTGELPLLPAAPSAPNRLRDWRKWPPTYVGGAGALVIVLLNGLNIWLNGPPPPSPEQAAHQRLTRVSGTVVAAVVKGAKRPTSPAEVTKFVEAAGFDAPPIVKAGAATGRAITMHWAGGHLQLGATLDDGKPLTENGVTVLFEVP